MNWFRALAVLAIAALSSHSRGQAEDELLLEALEASFGKHLVHAWYPKSVDKTYGGFLTNLDANWEPYGRQDKFIVGQARHVWTLSRLSRFLDDSQYAAMATQGKRFLIDRMWDAEEGGFFTLVSREGEVVDDGKTAYGMSFAIYALSSLYSVTEDEEALEYARRSFRWMEERSWDARYLGYVNDMERNGDWRIADTPLAPPNQRALGLKDYNSSIHLLECLTALYSVWPDPLVKERLEQMLSLVRDRFVNERGYLNLYFFQDWTALSLRGESRAFILENNVFDHVSWGHDVETAFLMLEAAHALGAPGDAETNRVAKRLVDHALATGWDEEQGSFYDGGYYFEQGGPCEIIRPEKVWWVAAEGLNALLLMSRLYPEEGRYEAAFRRQWAYIRSYLYANEIPGWHPEGTDSNPAAALMSKAHRWKAAYHDGRAYMNCIRMMRGEFALLSHR